MRFFVCVAVWLVMLACGILTVAEQVYGPLSDRVSGEKTCSTTLVFSRDMMVELGKIIIMSGNTTRPYGTSAEQWIEYL